MKALYKLLTQLSSRRWISKISGKAAKSGWSKRLIPRFINVYNINIEEAEKPLEQYKSLNDFFTRKLKSGARKIDDGAMSLISPVDGLITAHGKIQQGQMLQVKGQDYTVDELLGSSPRVVNYENGTYIILYLSPSDYHRIHAPVTGKIVEKDRIRGKVYPVHDFSMRNVNKVLSRNERLITYINHEFGEIAVVKVGAMNVSSIQYVDGLTKQVDKGQELGYFEFGSTVVLLMENGTFEPASALSEGNKVQMGQALGQIVSKQKQADVSAID